MQAGVPPQLNIMSVDEFIFLEFCITRFLAVAPMVTILEQTLFLSEGLYDQAKQISNERINGNNQGASGATKKPEIYYLTEYINRITLAPYSGSIQGSSLIGSLKSVMAVDLTAVWADVLAGR